MSRRSSPTIRDVAREAGVSVATVSRYINSSATVSPAVSERLQAVMTALRYVPQAAARHLAKGKTRLVGLLLPNLGNDFFVPLLNGVEWVVRNKGYNLVIATYHADSRSEIPPPIGPFNADGMLIFADAIPDDDLAHFSLSGFPMVLVYRTSPPAFEIPSVTVENIEITKSLIEHLIQVHGRRRILFMRGPVDQEDSLLREIGYRAALEANGLAYDERLILRGDFDRDAAYHALNEFLSSETRVECDAVFTGSDDAAIGVLKALHQHRLRIPEDISVAGFDDLGFARYLDPPLTTVRAPTESVGKLAMERLFSLLDNEPIDGNLVLPTEIIIRRSCGCQFEQ